MKRWIGCGVTFLLVSVLTVGFSLAADQKRDRKKDTKRDNSCQVLPAVPSGGVTLAADQLREKDQTREQKKDGSCRVLPAATADGTLMAGNAFQNRSQRQEVKGRGSQQGDRKQVRKRDQSC